MNKPKEIWRFERKVCDLLELSLPPNTPIFIGPSNYEHMKKSHPDDFERYGDRLLDILMDPDFISKHPHNGSIQFIKIFHDHVTNEHVMVAVRTSQTNVFYVRSLFVMSEQKKRSYTAKGFLKKYDS